MQEKKFKRHTITAALPYANGPIHIGHLAGVYIPADTYARYLRLKGEEVLFICGSDEHGVPITIRAREEGKSPKEVVDKFHNMIKKSFDQLGMSMDFYARTSSPVHYETASGFFKKLYEKGILEEATNKQYFDEEQQQFLADRYIIGTCPNCGYEEAYGDQCEKCGTSLSPNELINPRSALSGAQPVMKETRHWYLPLDKYEDWLRKWILDEHKEWKPNVYGQCKSWLDQGLQARAVTRDLDWGIPLPLEETEGKVLYVWFDAPIGYISSTKEWADQNNEDWKKYWQDEETRLIHFIGKDNIVFHCIIFPVMLKTHGDYILPDNVPANEFMNLEGRKISTSKNWAVWLHEYLEEFPGKEDVLRYMLSVNAPETKDNDFTWKDFQSRNNNELVAIFGNFVNRAVVLTHKYFDGQVPEQGALKKIDEDTLQALNTYPDRIGKAIENFHFREAAALVIDLARTGNKYLADTEPWKKIKEDQERVQTILNISLQITYSLAVVAEPFLPFTAEKLSRMLNIDQKSNWYNAGTSDRLTPGHLINKPELLFDKIEDEVVDAQLQKLMNNKASTPPSSSQPEQKEQVSFDDFQAMDIRIGTIMEAEEVKKSDKLLKLKVDTGIDKRTIMSGIAKNYTPEELKGKQVCVLSNLAPRKIMGVKSQGMLLMAEDANGQLALIHPDQLIANGSQIH